jgi:hypothetical protein
MQDSQPNKGGRPTDYSPEILTKAQEYLDSREDNIEVAVSDSGRHTSVYREVKLPTIEGLAYHLKVSRDTIYEWEKHEDKKAFSDIISDLRAKQAERLINQGLSGNYNSTIAKLMLHKHGYSDKQEIDHTTKGEPIKGINYVVPNGDNASPDA